MYFIDFLDKKGHSEKHVFCLLKMERGLDLPFPKADQSVLCLIKMHCHLVLGSYPLIVFVFRTEQGITGEQYSPTMGVGSLCEHSTCF